MEEKIFRLPDVFRILKDGYVEARLHTDGSVNIDRIKEKQAELTGSVATPIYVVIEPESEKILGLFEGATFDEQEFEDFLRAALAQGPW
jgi:hypothetical protein